MKFPLGVVLSLLPLFVLSAHAQTAPLLTHPFLSSATGASSSTDIDEAQPSEPRLLTASTQSGAIVATQSPRHLGIATQVGINGVGADIAVAVASHFNVRMGAQFFGYSDSFQEQGANVNAMLRLGGGRAALDWFPFHNGFHISPLVVFLDQTNVRATVIVPSGQTISLDNGDYVSSHADPLHGSASIGVWKTSPGLTIGYGNIVPRSGKHFSFPVDAGFYYVGQPTLKVDFSGSACDPSEPEPLGCQPVQQDADFQRDLAAFIRRNNNNLSYASFIPILSFGVGYSF
ncbi:hypothetical protein [Edaphobacter sp. DSM 109919]|uniref:Outer membrane beta-barrel protein n=1 Tax=Edaphobacter paludis TaxID=3035702 RepID=A0AAU7CWN0_9BACT